MFIEKLNNLLLTLSTNKNLEKDFLTLKKVQSYILGNQKSFRVETLLSLEEKHFNLAVGAINESIFQKYYGEDTKIKSLIFETDKDVFCNQKTFSAICLEHGLNYDPRFINTYYKRGKLPSEDLLIEGKPYWKRSTILNFLHSTEKK